VAQVVRHAVGKEGTRLVVQLAGQGEFRRVVIDK